MPKLSGSSSRAGGAASSAKNVLIVLLCASVLLVTLYAREGATGPVHVLRSAVQFVATPFTYAGAYLTRPLAAVGTAIDDAAAGEETFTELKERNAALMSQLAELQEYRYENERLRQMLSLSGAYGLQGVAARVIGGTTGDWTNAVTIDRGSSAGIAVSMPVTDGYGVVGQVTSVTPVTATVTLLSDPSSGVGALLQNSRSTGVLQGSVDGALHLEYVPVSATVDVGELVVTSGLGGVYPKGLLIGEVASVVSSPSDVYHSIVVTPVASAGAFEELYVITSFDAARTDAITETLLTYGTLEGAASSAEPDPVEGGE